MISHGNPDEQMKADGKALLEAARKLVKHARDAGASDADAVASRSRSFGVSVRNGAVEGTENSESDKLSLRVFVGRRVASISAAASSDFEQLAQRAVAMARLSPEDPSQGLADPDHLARDWPDLNLFDPHVPGSERLVDMAKAAEAAALDVKNVSASSGASAGYGANGLVLATSAGFEGVFQRSSFSISASAIAGSGTAMERDYDGCGRIHFSDLDEPDDIGRRAGERAAARIGATRPDTGKQAVVFDPRMARGLVGHIAGAVSGAAIARKASFLQNRMGDAILPANVTVTDEPHLPRRPGSRPFDGEGVGGQTLKVIEDGVLRHWLLSTSTARELGLTTNGRASRSGSSVTPAPTNFGFLPGSLSRESLLSQVGNGIYVTEVFGQGVNLVTGQYSRGASGFLIENGEITRPISEFTIAGNLADMFATLILADDVDPNYSRLAPTLAIPVMSIGGA